LFVIAALSALKGQFLEISLNVNCKKMKIGLISERAKIIKMRFYGIL